MDDWYQIASQLGLDPGRRRSGWVKIICPSCRRSRKGGACSFNAHTGGWRCFKGSCDAKGHLGSLWRENGHGDVPSSPTPEPDRIDTDVLDLHAAWNRLRMSRDRYTGQLQQWCRVRGWPSELAHHLPDLEDVAVALDTLKSDPVLERLIKVCRRRRLLIALRDAHGQVCSASRRTHDGSKPDGTKSRDLPNRLTGSSPLRVFGSIPGAVEAALRGERVYVVEGGPDFVAMSLYCAHMSEGAVIGAPGAGQLPKIARELAAQLLPLRGACHVVIIADRDKSGAGQLRSREAADVLSRVGRIALATATVEGHDACDLADVLQVEGLEGVDRLISSADVLHQAFNLDDSRNQLQAIAADAMRQGGSYAIAAPTRVGKTTAIIQALLAYLSRSKSKRVLYAVPRRELRDELVAAAGALAKRLGVFNVGIRAYKSRADDGMCQLGADEPGAAARAIQGGGSRVCSGCPYASACRLSGWMAQFQNQGARRPSCELIFATHDTARGLAQSDDRGGLEWKQEAWDVVVVDESPLSKLIETLPVTLNHLNAGQTHGDLEHHDFNALARLIGQRHASSEALASALPPGSIECGDGTATGTHFWSLAMSARSEPVSVLSSAPDWRTWGTLERACQDSWKGAYVRDEVLHLPVNAPMPTGAHATIYLDATATEEIAKIILPECQWYDLRAPIPTHTDVIQIEGWEATASNLRRAEKSRQKWIKAHQLHDSPTTLHVTFKSFVEELEGHVQGPVTHFRSTDYIGVSTYDHCETAVVDAWRVPKAPLAALAESLNSKAQRAHVCGIEPVDWDCVAHQQLQEADVWQVLGRIGPHVEPRTVVLLDDRKLPGLEPNQTFHGDLLEWATTGKPVGRGSWCALLRATVQGQGGVWCPSIPSDPVVEGTGQLLPLPCSIYTATLGQYVSRADEHGVRRKHELDKAISNHFNRNWERAADEAGLRCTYIRTSGQGKPRAILHTSSLTLADIQEALDGSCAWFEWSGRRHCLGTSPHSKVRELEQVAMQLVREGASVTTAALAARVDGYPRQIRRWLNAAGHDVADWLAGFKGDGVLQVEHDAAPTPTVIALQNDDALVEVEDEQHTADLIEDVEAGLVVEISRSLYELLADVCRSDPGGLPLECVSAMGFVERSLPDMTRSDAIAMLAELAALLALKNHHFHQDPRWAKVTALLRALTGLALQVIPPGSQPRQGGGSQARLRFLSLRYVKGPNTKQNTVDTWSIKG